MSRIVLRDAGQAAGFSSRYDKRSIQERDFGRTLDRLARGCRLGPNYQPAEKEGSAVDGNEANSFVWTFPVYVLAANVARDPDGVMLLSDNTHFAAPEHESGKRVMALFTDIQLANVFRDHNENHAAFEPIELWPESLLFILGRAQSKFPTIGIDLDSTTRLGQLMATADAIKSLENYLRQWGKN
jgi:hypothetical protein